MDPSRRNLALLLAARRGARPFVDEPPEVPEQSLVDAFDAAGRPAPRFMDPDLASSDPVDIAPSPGAQDRAALSMSALQDRDLVRDHLLSNRNALHPGQVEPSSAHSLPDAELPPPPLSDALEDPLASPGVDVPAPDKKPPGAEPTPAVDREMMAAKLQDRLGRAGNTMDRGMRLALSLMTPPERRAGIQYGPAQPAPDEEDKLIKRRAGEAGQRLALAKMLEQSRHQQATEAQGEQKIGQGATKIENQAEQFGVKSGQGDAKLKQAKEISDSALGLKGEIAADTEAGRNARHRDSIVANVDKAKQAGDRKDWGEQAKALDALKKDMDSFGGRAGELGKLQAIADRGNRVARLLFDHGRVQDLDNRQLEEVAIGVNALISGSSAPAVQIVKALMPHTIVGDTAKTKEWILNHPEIVNNHLFNERFANTVVGETELAKWQMHKARAARLPAHAQTIQRFAEPAKAMLSGYGMDPAQVDASGAYADDTGEKPPEVRIHQGKAYVKHGDTWSQSEGF